MVVKRQENIEALIVSLSMLLENIQIKGLADGTDLTDAVTLQQLNAVAVGQGWDEAVWDDSTGNLSFKIATVLDFLVNLDGRYPTTAEVTALIAAGAQTVFTLDMPTGTTVQQRIDGMVEGTDYPTGWVLAASGLDLSVTHNLGRELADATVFVNSFGSTFQKLTGTAAYSAAYSRLSATQAFLTSLATVNLPINVYLIFA